MSNDKSIVEQVGAQRYLADKRQFAGLLFGVGIASMVQPLADVASDIGPDGTTITTGVPFSDLWAGLSVIFLGLVAAIIGYLQLVHDWGNKYLTGFGAFTCQFAFIEYVTDMTAVGKAARTGAAFYPPALNASAADVHFVGAMGIISVIAYGFTSIGSIAFMEFALFAYQNGKQADRGGLYFFGRMSFYTMMLTFAGISQLLLGCYLLHNFGSGPLAGPVGAAVYVVSFPEIAIVVGLIQTINGLWGLFRSIFNMAHWGPNDNSYSISILIQWICMLSLQVVTQISYPPGGTLAAAAPSVALISIGLNVMPAFLDYKMRNLPPEFTEEYYGPEPLKVERESMKALQQSIISGRSTTSTMKQVPEHTAMEVEEDKDLEEDNV